MAAHHHAAHQIVRVEIVAQPQLEIRLVEEVVARSGQEPQIVGFEPLQQHPAKMLVGRRVGA